jgi:hypothetical protein
MRAWRDMTQDERRGAIVERKLARNTIRAVADQYWSMIDMHSELTC